MGLFDFFRQRPSATPSSAAASEPMEAARTRARRRLIGAAVLLGIGIIAFPILFETQPRPIPVDLPIRIPPRENASPLALPAPKPVVTASAPSATVSEAPRDPAPTSTTAPAPAVPARAKAAASAPAAAPVAAVAAPKSEPAPPPKAQPPAPPAPATVAVAAPKAEPSGRFVVQVGAFAESSAVRDARAKVEKLGLSTYTQVVETSGGARTRVRLGPYATREEADKVAGRVKASGLPAAVLTL